MASFTFGSVGDIIAICQIAQSTVSALNDARGSAADYQALSRSLANLSQALMKLNHLVTSKKNVINMAGLDQTLRDCYTCLKDFVAKVDKYSRALGERGQKNVMKDVFRKIKWMNEKEDVSNFHRDISTYLAMLQLLLQLAGFDINAADQTALHRRMSSTDTMITTGFSETYSLLEKIDKAIQLRGEGGVSNAAVEATSSVKRLERRTTSLADALETSRSTKELFDDALEACKTELQDVVYQCRRLNRLFTSGDFDLDRGLTRGENDSLVSLDMTGAELRPGCVRRITDIFERPEVFIKVGNLGGETVVSVDGYQYFAAVLATLECTTGLLYRIMTGIDEGHDAYSFLFFRDGEWHHSIIDGRLYLERSEYSFDEAQRFRITSKTQISEKDYRRVALTGSQALYFTASSDENETFIPLLEKAYASIHGDYGAIQNLYVGDVLEDFTGGVTQEIDLSAVPDMGRFWVSIFSQIHKEIIVFASNRRVEAGDRATLDDDTAQVAVLKAAEVTREDGGLERLLLLRYSRPGRQWLGPWSDGSEEWTPYWMQLLDHRFGDENTTWIRYRDFARHYRFASVHQVFGPEWQTVQLWAAFEIPWSQDTLRDAFHIVLSEPTEAVIVLSRLDPTYFRGLEGQYEYEIDFTVSAHNGGHIVRAGRRLATRRGNNVRVNLERGTYAIRPHVIARKLDASKSVNSTIFAASQARRDKLLKVAQHYDLAHAKVVGWREVNERVQYGKQRRLELRRAKETLPSKTTASEILDQLSAPSSVRADDPLGLDEWDAVLALGLRVLVEEGKASIELKRHQNGASDEHEIQTSAGTTLADYDSDETATREEEPDTTPKTRIARDEYN